MSDNKRDNNNDFDDDPFKDLEEDFADSDADESGEFEEFTDFESFDDFDEDSIDFDDGEEVSSLSEDDDFIEDPVIDAEFDEDSSVADDVTAAPAEKPSKNNKKKPQKQQAKKETAANNKKPSGDMFNYIVYGIGGVVFLIVMYFQFFGGSSTGPAVTTPNTPRTQNVAQNEQAPIGALPGDEGADSTGTDGNADQAQQQKLSDLLQSGALDSEDGILSNLDTLSQLQNATPLERAPGAPSKTLEPAFPVFNAASNNSAPPVPEMSTNTDTNDVTETQEDSAQDNPFDSMQESASESNITATPQAQSAQTQTPETTSLANNSIEEGTPRAQSMRNQNASQTQTRSSAADNSTMGSADLERIATLTQRFAENIEAFQTQAENLTTRIETLERQQEQASATPSSNDLETLVQTIEGLDQKLTALSRKVENLPKSSASPARASAPKAPPVTPSKPTPKAAPDWELRAAQPGRAWISRAGSTTLKEVRVGDTVEGLGRISAITQTSGGWSIIGTSARLNQ